jgi:peptide/nickel transport system substrate-binding protein
VRSRARAAIAACAFLAACSHASVAHHVLRFAEAKDPTTLVPELSTTSIAQDLGSFLFSYAVRYDARARPVPDALTELPTVANGDVRDGGLTLAYRLRRDIRWEDGVALTCADLKFTWQVIVNPHNNAIADAFSNVKSIDCRDPYVAIVHMKRPYAPFLVRLWGAGAAILPEHLLGRYNDARGSLAAAPYNAHPVGSGPFRLAEWRRGDEVRMVANPAFYLGKPKLDEVIYKVAPDENALFALLQSHEIDMLAGGSGLNWERYAAFATDPHNAMRAVSVDGFAYAHVDFNLRNPILVDRVVRRALAYAIDRRRIAATVFHGAAAVGFDDQSPTLSWAYDAAAPHNGYDPARAARMLEADGWRLGAGGIRNKAGQPLHLTLSTPAEGTANKIVEVLIERNWRAVGCDVELKAVPAAAFFAPGDRGMLDGGRYDAALFNWQSAPDPDHSSIYSGHAIVPHGENAMHWNDAVATAALDDAVAHVDQARRRRDYAIVQHELAVDVPTIVLYFPATAYVYDARLRGFDPSPTVAPFWDPWNYFFSLR